MANTSIFRQIDAEIAKAKSGGKPPIALHVGDSHFDLPKELTWPAGKEPWHPKLSGYGDTRGLWILRERLARKLLKTNALPVGGPENVQLTFGATGALMLAMRRLLDPGSTVLALAPYWPILRMVASVAGVKVVEVPFYDRVGSAKKAEEILGKMVTKNTQAIYINNPSNPSGVVLNKAILEAIARVAKHHDLKVLSDEAYEDFFWVNKPKRVSIGSLPGMFARTVSVYSFSKSFAAAGIRLGYLAAPAEIVTLLNAGMVGVGYEPPQPAQVMAMRGLAQRDTILSRLRKSYLAGLDAAWGGLGNIDVMGMDGGFFLMLDLRDRWKDKTERERLAIMLKAGVILSPGSAFGRAYDGWARLCFTAEPPERVGEAARKIARI
jgi:aspartate/methionine/tyrosine aminotransferase